MDPVDMAHEPAKKKKKSCCSRQRRAHSVTHLRHPLSQWTLCCGRTETLWFVIKCQWRDARAVDEWCKHQSRFRGERVSPPPVFCLCIADLLWIQQPTEQPRCHPTSSVRQCIMSPAKPLQCRSVTTHLFSQHSLASMSDCSLSSHIPALSAAAMSAWCSALCRLHRIVFSSELFGPHLAQTWRKFPVN